MGGPAYGIHEGWTLQRGLAAGR